MYTFNWTKKCVKEKQREEKGKNSFTKVFRKWISLSQTGL